MLTEALFTITKNGKNLFVDWWMDLKKKKKQQKPFKPLDTSKLSGEWNAVVVTTGMELETILLSEISQAQAF